MEPKVPAAEESVPAADECTTDPKRGFLSDETEIAPTGSFREVDAKEATTVEVTAVEEDPVSLERKVDDSAGLIQAQEKKLGPDVEAGEQLGAEETMPASTEQKEEKPNEAAPSSHGKHL